MAIVNEVGAQAKMSLFSAYRTKQAQKAIDSRKDSFRMNEFGDVGIVDFKTLKTYGNVDFKDVADVLGGREVKVRTPSGRQNAPKPHAVKLGWLESIFAKVANLFNARTTGRANRLQDEMELQFGRFAGRMVNLAVFLENGDRIDEQALRGKVGAELSEFIRQAESFVDLYDLKASNGNAVERFVRSFVKRFVNSIKDDSDSMKRLYVMANSWERQDVQNRCDLVMETLRDAIRPFAGDLPEVSGAAPVKDAAAAQVKKTDELAETVKKEKAFLRLSLSKKVKELRGLCEKAGGDMKVFEDAFALVAKRLDENLDEVKGLSGGAFRHVIEDMDATMRDVIAKGRSVIEETRGKKRKQDLLEELEKGYGDISRVDFEQTNECINELLSTNWKTAQRVKSEVAMKFLAEETLDDIVMAGDNDEAKAGSPVSTTINMMNDVIEKFSAARGELIHSIRAHVERYELMELLSDKENQPPESVDEAKWKAACRLVGGYLVNGDISSTKGMLNEHVALLMDHAEHFSKDLPASAKERINNVFNVFEVSLGFVRQGDMRGVAVNGVSFEKCEKETARLFSSLLKGLDTFTGKNEPADPLDAKVASAVRKCLEAKGMDIRRCVKTGVEATLENRQNGVMFRNESNEMCWIANDDLETLIGCLNKALLSVKGTLANSLAAEVAASRRSHELCRNEAIARVKKELTPLLTVMRTARGLMVCNSLARIRDGMAYIRDCRPALHSAESWNILCARAERAMSGMSGMDVSLVCEELKPLLDAISADVASSVPDAGGGLQLGKGKAILEENFSSDLGMLECYGERGGIEYGRGILNSTVKLMDCLAITFKRTADIQDLVFDSLEALPSCLAKLDALQKKGAVGGKWLKLNTGNLSASADKLRADLAAFSKKVMEYVTVLREDGVWDVYSDRRKRAIDEVKDALSICTSSFIPVVRMMSEMEVYLRERFTAYDNGETKGGTPPAICTDVDFAKTFSALHTAVNNAFCTLSEIPRGVLLAMSDTAMADGLLLLRMEQTYEGVDLNIMGSVINRQWSERVSIPYKGHGVFIYRGSASNDPAVRMAANVREIYHNGLDSASVRMTMLRRGGKSADLYAAVENVSLSIAAEKQRGVLSPAVIKAIEELVDGRVRIRSGEDLKIRIQAKVPKVSAQDLSWLETDGGAADLAMKLISLASKWESYGILDEGATLLEYHAMTLDEYVKASKVKGFDIVSVGNNQGQIDRVLVGNAAGNKAFYTMKHVDKKVIFTPEPGSAKDFRQFSVPESYSSHGKTVKFPDFQSLLAKRFVVKGDG